jgi:hypothetical protein
VEVDAFLDFQQEFEEEELELELELEIKQGHFPLPDSDLDLGRVVEFLALGVGREWHAVSYDT